MKNKIRKKSKRMPPLVVLQRKALVEVFEGLFDCVERVDYTGPVFQKVVSRSIALYGELTLRGVK